MASYQACLKLVKAQRYMNKIDELLESAIEDFKADRSEVIFRPSKGITIQETQELSDEAKAWIEERLHTIEWWFYDNCPNHMRNEDGRAID